MLKRLLEDVSLLTEMLLTDGEVVQMGFVASTTFVKQESRVNNTLVISINIVGDIFNDGVLVKTISHEVLVLDLMDLKHVSSTKGGPKLIRSTNC